MKYNYYIGVRSSMRRLEIFRIGEDNIPKVLVDGVFVDFFLRELISLEKLEDHESYRIQYYNDKSWWNAHWSTMDNNFHVFSPRGKAHRRPLTDIRKIEER